MKKRHIAFIVESAHGHINPTLGITTLLADRGYRVTYPVKEYFADRVVASGAEAHIYYPLENKLKVFREMQNSFGEMTRRMAYLTVLCREEREDTLSQLEAIYRNDKPDLIIYDEGPYLAGRALAYKWAIPAIRYVPAATELPYAELVNGADPPRAWDPALILTPRFFCRDSVPCDDRFHFVGPIYNARTFFRPWKSHNASAPTILVSATTGLLPQIDFFKTVIRAFENSAFAIVLSVGEEVSPAQLAPLPANFEINQHSSQLEILEQSCLFIGQGGPGSTMEALYCGVPLLLIPPSPVHSPYAVRAAELGVGLLLEATQASADSLRQAVDQLLEDTATVDRARQIKEIMRADEGGARAVALIDRKCQFKHPPRRR